MRKEFINSVKQSYPVLNMSYRAESDDKAVIDIFGEIGWVAFDGEDITWNTKEAIKRQLDDLAKAEVKEILVNISSPGGFVSEGLTIHDVLAEHSAKVITRVTGMTASAATVIAQAGDERQISANALYLIHKSWSLVIGNAFDLKAVLEDSQRIDEVMAELYAKRSGTKVEKITELMNENNGDGKFLKAEEAKEYGLIDTIYEPSSKASSDNINDRLNALEDITAIMAKNVNGTGELTDEEGNKINYFQLLHQIRQERSKLYEDY